MRRVDGRDGIEMPVLGQGTYRMGEDLATRKSEVAALRLGLDLGMTVVDTAEMYGSGGAERVVADAIHGRRDEVFLVSKVLPANASLQGTVKACEASLRRLRTDRLDLYLLHWPSAHPLEDTLAGFRRLREQGKIRHYGVSNFDVDDLRAAMLAPGGREVCCNQILYNLGRRGPEWRLLGWCEGRGVVVMAYTPLERARLQDHPTLAEVARRREATPAQVALAWTLRRPGIVTIPKASTEAHVRENAAAVDLFLSGDDLAALDEAFPRPSGPQPLEML